MIVMLCLILCAMTSKTPPLHIYFVICAVNGRNLNKYHMRNIHTTIHCPPSSTDDSRLLLGLFRFHFISFFCSLRLPFIEHPLRKYLYKKGKLNVQSKKWNFFEEINRNKFSRHKISSFMNDRQSLD